MKDWLRVNNGNVSLNTRMVSRFEIRVIPGEHVIDGVTTKTYKASLFAYINVGNLEYDFMVKSIPVEKPEDVQDTTKGIKSALFNALE